MMRDFAMKQAGLTFTNCYANPDAYVEAQLRCHEATGTDAVWDLFGIAALEEAAGSVLTTPEDEPPPSRSRPCPGGTWASSGGSTRSGTAASRSSCRCSAKMSV